METAAVEYLVYLRQNACQLRKQAEEWGFTEEEINQCIEEALESSDNSDALVNSPKNVVRKCMHYFRVLLKTTLKVVCLIVALFIGVTILSTYHQPTEHFLSRHLQPYGYQIFRTIRLVTLPIHKVMNITEYYDSECIFENPFFEEPFNIDCNICVSYTNVKVANASTFKRGKFIAFANTLKPVQLQDTLASPVTYQDLRKMYLADHDMSGSPHNLHSTEDKYPDLDSLFLEDNEVIINTTDNLHIHWESHTVRISVALRALFPRPRYVPEKSEVGLDKHVLIDGPNTATYALPKLLNTVNVYMQGSGSRRILLRPKGPCLHQCNSLLAFMKPGDALMFHYDLWSAYAATTAKESSIGYLVGINI